MRALILQDDHRLLTRRAFGAVLAAGSALSFVDVAEAAGIRMKVGYKPVVLWLEM